MNDESPTSDRPDTHSCCGKEAPKAVGCRAMMAECRRMLARLIGGAGPAPDAETEAQ